jgi:hypothetical protein
MSKVKAPTGKSFVIALASFLIGAVAVGLVLLEHEHCEAGHAHGH